MSYLTVSNLHYRYPGSGEEALRGVDLAVDRGEIVAVVGPNASGKTTLALLLKGLLKPTLGAIRLDGEVGPGKLPDTRIGLLFANPENQLVTSIVEEDVAFALEAAGRPPAEIREAVDSVLHRLGIQDLRSRSPHRLSGGEQQMVALAGTLISGPELLVLDEPTAYLDPVGRRRVMTALMSLAGSGMAIILITHNMEEAAAVHRMLVMVDGRVTAAGAPDRIFAESDLMATANLQVPFGALKHGQGGARLPVAGPEEKMLFPDPGQKRLVYDAVSYAHPVSSAGTAPVLEELSTGVAAAGVRILCGANGAGKSTVMQLGNGLLKPDSGRVLFRDRDLRALGARRGHVASRIGLLFQKPERQVFAETVLEDVAFGPRSLGLSDGEIVKRTRESLAWVGLPEDLWERSPHTLSGGQLRRVAVAGVLALGAQVLLLDEPTDGLDPVSVDRFWSRMRDYVRKTGTAVYLATHQIPDQISAADDVDFLAGGIIAASGRAGEVLLEPDLPLDEFFLPAHVRHLREHGSWDPGQSVDISRAAVGEYFDL